MLLDCYTQVLKSLKDKKKIGRLHHAYAFCLEYNFLNDEFANSLCEMILGIDNIDYKNSPYISVIGIDNSDVKVVELKETLKKIEIKAHNDNSKIFIIKDLDNLNLYCENALLKVLEEPPASTYFILFYQSKANAWATIMSRCLKYDINFSKADKESYLAREFVMGEQTITKALLLTRGDLDKVVKIKTTKNFWQARQLVFKLLIGYMQVDSFLKSLEKEYINGLYWLNSIIVDMYFLKAEIVDMSLIANQDQQSLIQSFIQAYSLDSLYDLYTKSLAIKRTIQDHKSVDKELLLDDLIADIYSHKIN